MVQELEAAGRRGERLGDVGRRRQRPRQHLVRGTPRVGIRPARHQFGEERVDVEHASTLRPAAQRHKGGVSTP